MGIFRRKKDLDPSVNGEVQVKGRKRRIALTFSVLAITVGLSYTWYKKDPTTGERPKAEKEIIVTKPDVNTSGDTTDVDTLFHLER